MTGRGWRFAAVPIAVVVAVLMAGCSGFESPRFGGPGDDELQPGYDEYQEPQYDAPDPEPPTEDEIRQMTTPNEQWSCFLSPTMNDDWHDDVLCQRGYEYQRPYLREWDDFVTEDELMESAREYEAQLNAAG